MRLNSRFLGACFALALALPALGQKTIIRTATIVPDGTPMMQALKDMAAKVEKETGGEVVFKFFAGGTVGDEKLVIDKMKTNAIHAGAFTGVALGDIVPEVRILEIPWFFGSEDETLHALHALSDRFVSRFADEGYVHLGWNVAGAVYVFSKSRVSSVETMKQAKPWIWEGDPLAEEVFRAFSINPIPLALTAVLTNLQTNLIDTVYNTPSALIGLQWHDNVKYMVEYPIVYTVGALLISKAAFEKIPEKHRAKVKSVCWEASEQITEFMKEENKKALETLKGRGIEFIAPDAKDASTFDSKGQEVAKNLTGKLWDERLMERVLELKQEFKDQE